MNDILDLPHWNLLAKRLDGAEENGDRCESCQGILKRRGCSAIWPMTAEREIRKALAKRVADYGGEIRAVSWLGRSNAPDVLALFPPKSLFDRRGDDAAAHPFIETKRPGKAATEAQAREHERMREAGCVVLVITTHEELDAWLPPL